MRENLWYRACLVKSHSDTKSKEARVALVIHEDLPAVESHLEPTYHIVYEWKLRGGLSLKLAAS